MRDASAPGLGRGLFACCWAEPPLGPRAASVIRRKVPECPFGCSACRSFCAGAGFCRWTVNPTPPCALQAVAGPDLPVAALWVDSGPGDRLTLCVSLPHLQALARFSSRSAAFSMTPAAALGSWARLVSPWTLSKATRLLAAASGAQQRRCDRFALGSRPQPMKKPALVGAGKDNWWNRLLSLCSKRRRRCSPVARQSPCCRGTRRRQRHRIRRARSRWRTPPSLPW